MLYPTFIRTQPFEQTSSNVLRRLTLLASFESTLIIPETNPSSDERARSKVQTRTQTWRFSVSALPSSQRIGAAYASPRPRDGWQTAR
jgi:hypothetical protein